MKTLLLIRHGLTEGNVRRWYYGALDLPLCPDGEAALRKAAAAGLYPPADGRRIVTSGLLRTEQTLRLLYGEQPHEQWAELREVNFGVFEGRSYDELNGRADYEAWVAGDWFYNVPPGGESFAQAERRILTGLARMQAQPEEPRRHGPDDHAGAVSGGEKDVLCLAAESRRRISDRSGRAYLPADRDHRAIETCRRAAPAPRAAPCADRCCAVASCVQKKMAGPGCKFLLIFCYQLWYDK